MSPAGVRGRALVTVEGSFGNATVLRFGQILTRETGGRSHCGKRF